MPHGKTYWNSGYKVRYRQLHATWQNLLKLRLQGKFFSYDEVATLQHLEENIPCMVVGA